MKVSSSHDGSVQGALDWRALVKSWRVNQGFTQLELAQRSGFSLDSIKGYESGRRRPSAHALQCVIQALGIPRHQANRVLTDAGYAVEWNAVFEGRYAPLTMEELQHEVDSCVWPAFVANQVFDVVAQNGAFERLLEVDAKTDLLGFGERDLLGGITHDEFAERLLNWDQVVTFMCGLIKGELRWRGSDLAHPAPWFERSVQHFLKGNPGRIKRLMELWEAVPPIPVRLRQSYRVCWRQSTGAVLAFSARLAIADIWNEMHWNEWIPEDVETWQALHEITRQS